MMSIQWTLVAGVMYVELGVTIILLIPFISPQRWNCFFKSNFLRSIGNMGHIYFKIFLGILVLFFVDAIREMRKYTGELDDKQHSDHGHHLDSDMQSHMRLFRAQRNFYISGFSLFLWIVIQRLTTLISRLAISMAEKEAAMQQAKSASAAASQLLADEEKNKKEGKEEKDEAQTNLINENKDLKEANVKLEKEHQAALKQAKAVSNEYDRLMNEHAKLQDEYKNLVHEEGSKKSD